MNIFVFSNFLVFKCVMESQRSAAKNILLHDIIFPSCLNLRVPNIEHVALQPFRRAYPTLSQLQLIVCLVEKASKARDYLLISLVC